MTQLNTQFFEAVAEGNATRVNELIAQGVDVNAKDRWRYTALHWASSNGDLEVVKALIAAGADVNARDRLNRTPLHFAICLDDVPVVKALVATVDIKDLDINGHTPSFYASEHVCLKVAAYLKQIELN